MENLVKRPELLKESNRDFDFFDFETHAKNLYDSLESDITPTVTVLVGSYGTGKSVLLNEVNKLSDKTKAKSKPKWVLFECWQYPDKSDLWEALILELVEEIDGEEKRNKLTKSYSNIEGWRDRLVGFLSDIRSAVATVLGIAFLSWLAFSFADDAIRNTFLALLTAIVLVVLVSVEYLAKPESKSNISKLSDYKQELEKTLLKNKDALYIIVEDVDRAGELGRQFFETVAHFIKEPEFKKKNIKVIVPIADLSDDKKSLCDSIDKASDNILYFTPRYNCEHFVSEVFSEVFLDEPTKQLVVSTINATLGRSINIRKLKHALRNAAVKHQRLLKKDFKSQLAICIAVELSKYMNDEYGRRSIYDSRANNYSHKPLFAWASAKGMINRGEDETDKQIKPREHFQMSNKSFEDITFEDLSTNTSTGRVPIYNREYYISREYFVDL
jgi:hypothetical protein